MQWIILAVLCQAAALMAQSPTASIQGTVTDATSKKAVAGALVTAVRSGLPPASQRAGTAADGSFQIGSLAAGNYSLCIQAPVDGYLDPCQWINTATKITLAAGQKSVGNVLKIGGGSVLKIRVDDPGQLLAKKTKDGRDPHLLVGAWGPNGLFYPVHLVSKDSTGANFQLTIPRDTPVKLHVASGDLKIADAKGVAVAASGQQQFHSPGDASLKYTIVGVVP